MIQPGENRAFDMVEAAIKIKIQRVGLWANIITVMKSQVCDPYDLEVVDLYRMYITIELEAIKSLVNWCWNKGLLDRWEAGKIIHWLIWFNFPEDGQ